MMNFKYVCLVVLIIQTTTAVITMRYSRIQKTDKPKYLPSTAVFLGEIIKVIVCIGVIIISEGFNFRNAFKNIKYEIFNNYTGTLKVFIPAGLYTIQNNLLYVALSHLDASTYQITYQLKILTTAVFSVLMLRRYLNTFQWISLFLLMLGVSLVQLSNKNKNTSTDHTFSSQFVGLIAVILACLSSGFSGVYFEKILKESKVSLWIRNIQMGILSIFLASLAVIVSDYSIIKSDGFFRGYNYITWIVIFLQAIGGLIIAMVIKYADNILKGFATSLSIIVSSIVSYYLLGDFVPTGLFILGTTFVIGATFLYGYTPKKIVPILKM